MFRPVFKRSPAPSSLLVIAPKVPPPELPAPPPCPAALVFIPPVTRGSGKPEVGGAGRGRKVKGTECLSFLRLTGFSTALGRRCIVGSRRRACDARIRRGAHLLAPPVVCKVALLFLGTSTPFIPPHRLLLLHPPVQNGGGGGSGGGDGSSGLPGFVSQLRRSLLFLGALRAAARPA